MLNILPQTTQDQERIFLIDENLALCESGKILYYDDLGQLQDTDYECILDEINEHTSLKDIFNNIINLKDFVVNGYYILNLIDFKIDNIDFSIQDDIICFRDYKINLDSLEIQGKMIELDKDLSLSEELQNISAYDLDYVKAIVCAIYRKNITGFIEKEKLLKSFSS
ncbi:hypothetical protein IO405_001526 [Campylobacter lari]|nr:hypothetical protein [Campylobacter lari]